MGYVLPLESLMITGLHFWSENIALVLLLALAEMALINSG